MGALALQEAWVEIDRSVLLDVTADMDFEGPICLRGRIMQCAAPKRPRIRKPHDPQRAFYTCDELSMEFHLGVTKIRAWFMKNQAGCIAEGHKEQLHKQQHISIRISPAARVAFLKAYGLKERYNQAGWTTTRGPLLTNSQMSESSHATPPIGRRFVLLKVLNKC
jgi:hypothetical protein